jgi:hypothetical protein
VLLLTVMLHPLLRVFYHEFNDLNSHLKPPPVATTLEGGTIKS